MIGLTRWKRKKKKKIRAIFSCIQARDTYTLVSKKTKKQKKQRMKKIIKTMMSPFTTIRELLKTNKMLKADRKFPEERESSSINQRTVIKV